MRAVRFPVVWGCVLQVCESRPVSEGPGLRLTAPQLRASSGPSVLFMVHSSGSHCPIESQKGGMPPLGSTTGAPDAPNSVWFRIFRGFRGFY